MPRIVGAHPAGPIAVGVAHSGNQAERRIRGRDGAAEGAGVAAAELRVIQDVHRICAQLEAHRIREREFAADAHVDVEPVVRADLVVGDVGVAIPELIRDDTPVRRRHHAAGEGVGVVFEIRTRRRRDDAAARQRDLRLAVIPAPEVLGQHEVHALDTIGPLQGRAVGGAGNRQRESGLPDRGTAHLPSAEHGADHPVRRADRFALAERQLVEERRHEPMRDVAVAEAPVEIEVGEAVVPAARACPGVEVLVVFDGVGVVDLPRPGVGRVQHRAVRVAAVDAQNHRVIVRRRLRQVDRGIGADEQRIREERVLPWNRALAEDPGKRHERSRRRLIRVLHELRRRVQRAVAGDELIAPL